MRSILVIFMFISVAMLTMYGGASFAQERAFRGGLMAGLTASEVSGDRSGGPNKLGWFASVYTDYPLSDFSFWHLELLYVQKGSREFKDPEDPSEGSFRDYKFSLQYVEVPLLFKIYFPVARRLPYTSYLGGEMGLSVSKVIGHFETNDFGDPITDVMAQERPFRPAELNLILGFSVPLRNALAFNIRYNQGITPLRDHASGRKLWYNRGQYNTAWMMGFSMTVF